MSEGFVEYRHPVQGWTMRLPVEDTNDPPKVFFVKGSRLERADLEPTPRRDALTLAGAVALARLEQAGAWALLPEHRRARYVLQARAVQEALEAEGALS